MKYVFHLIAVIAAFALLFSAYGGHVDPTIWSLPSLATLVLPVVAMVALILLALLAVFRQWRSAAILVGALLLSWPVLRQISPFNLSNPKPAPEATTLKVLTMNVKEFNWEKGNKRANKSMRYILDQDADIVTIQEGTVYFTYEQLATVKPMLKELYKKYPYRKKGHFDVGILSKYPFTEIKSSALSDSLGYFIKAWNVEAPGGDITVVSMHLSSLRFTGNDTRILDSMNKPSGRKKRAKSVMHKLTGGFRSHARQATALRKLLDETTGDVLVMGDMNDTPGSFAYRTVCGDDLRDAWAGAGFGPLYTFHTNHLYVKIDHILYRGDLKLLSCYRDKAGESDHYPLVAVFER